MFNLVSESWVSIEGHGYMQLEGKINLHVFEDWCGATVQHLRQNLQFPQYPHSRLALDKLEIAPNWINYGLRLFGFLHPPVDGKYEFAISSDDNSELWLSQDEDSDNIHLIAFVGKTGNEWTAPGEYTRFKTQVSLPIWLSSTQQYYMEVLHKQDDLGTDHVEVAPQTKVDPCSTDRQNDAASRPDSRRVDSHTAKDRQKMQTGSYTRDDDEDLWDLIISGSGSNPKNASIIPDLSCFLKPFPRCTILGRIQLEWKQLSSGGPFFIIDSRHISLYVDEMGMMMDEVEHIPLTKATRLDAVPTLDAANGTQHPWDKEINLRKAATLNHNSQDDFYQVPLLDPVWIKGVLPEHPYNPSYTIRGLPLLHNQELQFVHLTYVYPNDYTRLTHAERENACTYNESHKHPARFGYNRYMEMGLGSLDDDLSEDLSYVSRVQAESVTDAGHNGLGAYYARHISPEDIGKISLHSRITGLFGALNNNVTALLTQTQKHTIKDLHREIGKPLKVEYGLGNGQAGMESLSALGHGRTTNNSQKAKRLLQADKVHQSAGNWEGGEIWDHLGSYQDTVNQNNVKPLISMETQDPISLNPGYGYTRAAERHEMTGLKYKTITNGMIGLEKQVRPTDKTQFGYNNGNDIRITWPRRTGRPLARWQNTIGVSTVDVERLQSDQIKRHCNTSGNMLIGSQEATAIASVFMRQLNIQHPGLFRQQRLVSMEKRRDHVQGDRYLLEMELEMEDEFPHRARKRRVAEYVFVPRPRGQTRSPRGFIRPGSRSFEAGELLLFKPKGFQWQPRKTVHFLVPVRNQACWLLRLISEFERLFVATGDADFSLVLADGSSDDMVVEKALKRSSLPRYHYVRLNGRFQRAAALQAGADLITDPHSILFLGDLHLTFPHSILDSIRKHCIEHTMTFAPIVMCLDCGSTPEEPRGYWEVNGFGLFAMYKSDFERVGGLNTQEAKVHWGGKDRELLYRVLAAGMEVVRLRLRHFYHHFHSSRGTWEHSRIGARSSNAHSPNA
uniref:beta-1,4-N-acetylgalactosaminyltransferase 3-like n=1 Tax=Myxine glutinosa TaxID=7769 RepID=UPI00358E0F39